MKKGQLELFFSKRRLNPRIQRVCCKCKIHGEHYTRVVRGKRTHASPCAKCMNKRSIEYGKTPRGKQKMKERESSRRRIEWKKNYYSAADVRTTRSRQESARAKKEGSIQKRRARKAIMHEVRMGRILRPEACERCNLIPSPMGDGRSALQAHHHKGYEEDVKLDVEWLCFRCHTDDHVGDTDG